jgi:hypothetical protein
MPKDPSTPRPPRGGRRRVAPDPDGKAIALYHVVYRHERFEEAAQALFEMVRYAQGEFPGRPRMLFLDIEGHRNSQGGFDAEMYELQRDFVLGCSSRT